MFIGDIVLFESFSVFYRATDVQASYLEEGQFSLVHSQGSDGGREKFVLSLKEDL